MSTTMIRQLRAAAKRLAIETAAITRTLVTGPLGTVTCLACIGSLVSGCFGNAIPSLRQPERLYSIDDEIGRVRIIVDHEAEVIRNYILAPSEEARNAIITARMYAIDVLYTKYESQLTHEGQDINFAANVANLGLNGAATLIPVVQTKNLLNQIGMGVTGINTAYNEKILLTNTIQNIQTQMRTNRNEQAAVILGNMKCSVRDYPLAMGLSDVEGYYRAGTFTAGLLELSKTTHKAEDEAKAKKNVQSPGAPPEAKAKLTKEAAVKIAAAQKAATGCQYKRGPQNSLF